MRVVSPLQASWPLPTSHLQLVFALVSVGAIILTVNVVLLGGTIGFFQSLCLLGYCLFPLDVAAIVCVTTDLLLIRWGLAGLMRTCRAWRLGEIRELLPCCPLAGIGMTQQPCATLPAC